MYIVNGLEDCPFCKDGGTPVLKVYEADAEGMYSGVVECLDCGVAFEDRCSSLQATKNTLVNRWNTRHEPTCQMIMYDGKPACSECKGELDYNANYCEWCGLKVES